MKYLVIVCLCVAGISSAAWISPLASVNDAEGVIQEEWLYNEVEDKDAPSIDTTEGSTSTTEGSTTTTEGSTTTTEESISTTEESISTTEESSTTTEGSITTNEGSSTTTYESSASSEDISTTEITTTTTLPPGLSDGAIAGIVIGSIAAAVLLAGGIYFMKIKGMACFG